MRNSAVSILGAEGEYTTDELVRLRSIFVDNKDLLAKFFGYWKGSICAEAMKSSTRPEDYFRREQHIGLHDGIERLETQAIPSIESAMEKLKDFNG